MNPALQELVLHVDVRGGALVEPPLHHVGARPAAPGRPAAVHGGRRQLPRLHSARASREGSSRKSASNLHPAGRGLRSARAHHRGGEAPYQLFGRIDDRIPRLTAHCRVARVPWYDSLFSQLHFFATALLGLSLSRIIAGYRSRYKRRGRGGFAGSSSKQKAAGTRREAAANGPQARRARPDRHRPRCSAQECCVAEPSEHCRDLQKHTTVQNQQRLSSSALDRTSWPWRRSSHAATASSPCLPSAAHPDQSRAGLRQPCRTSPTTPRRSRTRPGP